MSTLSEVLHVVASVVLLILFSILSQKGKKIKYYVIMKIRKNA